MKRLHGEQGFTIIETLVAMLIIAVAFLGLAGVHILSTKAQSLGNNQGIASFLANEQIEEMRRSSFADITTLVETVTKEGVSFVVIRVVSEVDLAKRVDVAVVWTARLGVRSITISSLISSVTNP